jgi:hypothetical protein
VWDHEEAEETHDVIDAQTDGVPERASQHEPERLVPCARQAAGRETRDPPVLPGGAEGIRRSADGEPSSEGVRIHPGVGSTRVHADGQVEDQTDGFLRSGELLVQVPLQPGEEAHARGLCFGQACDGR